MNIRYQLWLDNKAEKIKQLTSVVILLMTLLYCGHLLKNIPGTQQARDSFLKNRIHSYEIGLFLKKHPEYRSVQIGLESDVYYLPRGTLGEVFGPYRYQDFLKLSTPELSNKIKALHANSLILSNKRNSQSITSRSDFKDYFKLLLDTGDAQLYLVK
ncbi:hypothetical protein GCM10009007_05550 [Formosimonas limnophila]|uniref:Uncharacterized protein n=1 Tax=Formosimonas limnophila TaxID=1384487 RepID=A0A8J3CM05_9BURK|nr:hypothetical protein GCM10009007_05550 [Formosimonas limnophila]